MINFNIFKRLFRQEEPEQQTVEEQPEPVTESVNEEPAPSEFTSAEIIFKETEPKIKQLKKQRTYRTQSKYR